MVFLIETSDNSYLGHTSYHLTLRHLIFIHSQKENIILNANTPTLSAQLMTENPLSTVCIIAMAFVALTSTYIAVVAYKAEKAERNTAQLNAMDEQAELDLLGVAIVEVTQQLAPKAL